MIILTTQIETSPVHGGISILTTLKSSQASEAENYVHAVLNAAMSAAGEHLMEETKSGNGVVGGTFLKDAIKARLQAGGLKWEGSEAQKTFRRHKGEKP
ncbi:MAG: hypothetical protein JWQ04_2766 [Pedosphaera sp.]|nr:hypothetical protein [Pedosphaera sp.]